MTLTDPDRRYLTGGKFVRALAAAHPAARTLPGPGRRPLDPEVAAGLRGNAYEQWDLAWRETHALEAIARRAREAKDADALLSAAQEAQSGAAHLLRRARAVATYTKAAAMVARLPAPAAPISPRARPAPGRAARR